MANKTFSNEEAKALLRATPTPQKQSSQVGGTVKPSSTPYAPKATFNKSEAKSLLRTGTITPAVSKMKQPIDTNARDIAVRKAFAARQDKSVPTPVMPKIAELVKTYTPTYAGRLSGGGMNLTGNTYDAVIDKRADDGRRLKAGAATLGYSTLGMIPNFVETTDQALKNAADNNRFIGKNEAYKAAAKEARGVNAYAHGRLNTELGTVTKAQQEFEALYEKADSVKTKTSVDQNKTGQRLMAKARESQEIATEGMGGVEKLIADTAISMYQNAPGIALTAITKAPVAGLSLMGLQAASAKTAELNARGLAPNEALVRGAATGAIESVTEKLPLDNLLDIAKGKAGQNFLKNVFKQAGIEGAEEGVAYTANYVADAMANDPEAQFSLADLGLAMAAGALSGGVFGVGGSMIGSKSDKVSDPVTEAMSTSQDAATRTTAEVQKANPDMIAVTPDAEALMAQGVKPTTAVDITKNVIAVTEGAAGITSKQIESILKDPKAAALFEQKSGIKLSPSKAEARVQIKEFYAQTVEVKASELVAPVTETAVEGGTFAPDTQELSEVPIAAEEPTFDPNIPMEVDGQIVQVPIEEVRQKLTQSGLSPAEAEARLQAYDADVQRRGAPPRFAPFTADNKNTAVEAFTQDNDTVLKELGLSGIEVYYAPPRNDPQTGLRIREEGLFDRSRNVVRLNGAVLKGQDAAAAVVSHELVHKAATKDEAITDRIIASFEQTKGLKLDNRYKKYALKYNGFVPGVDASAINRMTPAEVAKLLTDEQKSYLREEIASDLMKEVLGTKKKMEQFAKSGGKSVLEQVRVIIDRILSALGNKNATLRVAYNNMLRDLDAVLRSAEVEKESKSEVRASIEAAEVDSDGNELSAEQAEFFKDSMVRDENGKLLVVYHGTQGDFHTFKEGNALGWGRGIYFTDNKNATVEYGDRTIAAYLDIRNPFNGEYTDSFEKTYAFKKYSAKEGIENGYDLYSESGEFAGAAIRELGYDGIIAQDSNDIEGFEVVAFSPEQIKSVDNKNPTDDPDIRYSLETQEVKKLEQKTAELQSELKASERQTKNLQEKNVKLKDEMKLTADRQGIRVDRNSVKRVATKLLRENKSSYDAEELQDRLLEFYSDIQTNSIDWGETDSIAYNIAQDILRYSTQKFEPLPEYNGVREYLRKTKLHVPEDLHGELESEGGYNYFRKSNMGRMKLSSKDGKPVDEAYNELSNDYPGLFDEKKHSNPGDQLIHMAEELNKLQPGDYTSSFIDTKGELLDLASQITDGITEVLTDKPTQADKIASKVRSEYEALPFNVWLEDQLANNKTNAVYDIIHQKSSSLLNPEGGKPVYFTTKQARSLTRFLETVQADLTGLQEEVVAVKVESTKKVERVRKEAKVDANWTAAQNKKRTDWLEAKAVHEVEVKAAAAKERLEARMEKINAENTAKVELIKAADAKRYAKVEKQLEHQKRKRRLASVKGVDAAKTMRKYQTEKNKQKAVEDKGARFIANISKVPEPKTFGEKVDAAKQAVREGANTARFIVENNLQEFDNFSSWEEVTMTSALVKRAQNMPSMAYNILTSEYMTPDGEFGGTSLSEVIHIKDAKGKIDREAQDIYNEYLYVMHTADRMAFIERAKEKVLAFETAHPDIAALDSEGLADVITARERSDETKANKALAEEYTKLLKELNTAQDKPVLAWESEDQPGVRDAMTAEEARERAATLRADNDWLVERSEALYAWWDRFVRDWAVGVQITEAEYEQMREIYPHYVPTFRVQEKQGKAGGSTAGGGVSTSSVFKPAKGSTKDLKRADDNFVTQLQKICNQRGMSDLCTWMMDQAYSQPDVFGDRMLVADPTGEDAVDVSADLDDRSSAADAMLTVGKDGMYKLTTWRDGEKIEAYVSKNMYRGFQALTKANRIAWVETGVKWGRWITGWSKMAITGYSPSFMVRNPIMDFPTAVVNSTVGTKFPMYYFKAINAIRTNSEEWRRFKAMGGTQSNFYNQEKGFEDNSRLAVKKGPLHWVSKANENTEGVTRFAEYLATIEKYGDTQEGRALGLKNAAEITVDFNRTGELGRILNAWIPYHNPAVQGISRQLRLVFGGQQKSIQQRAGNLGIVLTRATLVSLMPEIVLQALYAALGEDDEWRKLTAWERGSNYCIPRHWFTGDPADKGLFVKIPKSREWSRYIGTPFMMMTDAFSGKEDAFEGYFEQVLKPSVSPPMIPILVQQAVDLKTNKTFTGADIVPGPYQGLEEVEGGKQEQWNDKTSNLAIFIGGMIDFSPMQIDYLAGSLFGNWGKFITQMTGNPGLAASNSTVAEGLWYNFNNNFTRRFVSDNVYSNATTSKFYDTYTEVEGAWKLEKLRGKDPDNSMIKQTSAVMSEYFDRISDINKEIRALNLTPMPKKDRDEKNRALRQSINAIAAEAMSKYEDIQRGKSKNPKLEMQYEDLGMTAPVSKELIKLKDVEGYNFQPVKVGKSFADPRRAGYEYKLEEEHRAEYNIIYMELYNQTMATAISKASYQNADNEGRAAKLATARDGVGSRPSLTDQARSEFLKRNKDLKSTKK